MWYRRIIILIVIVIRHIIMISDNLASVLPTWCFVHQASLYTKIVNMSRATMLWKDFAKRPANVIITQTIVISYSPYSSTNWKASNGTTSWGTKNWCRDQISWSHNKAEIWSNASNINKYSIDKHVCSGLLYPFIQCCKWYLPTHLLVKCPAPLSVAA